MSSLLLRYVLKLKGRGYERKNSVEQDSPVPKWLIERLRKKTNKTVFVIRNQDLTSGFIGEFWKGRKKG
ncbi:hypothetical protein QE152_g32004 [Popillia japonica]|uniref:Ribosomal protein L31 n=1 Tax=Popillia japonica TaxID=7064 RepID=A0AAW1J0I0_POPJA